MATCYYEALEINKTATQQQVKQAYKRLALKYHPDKNTDKEFSTIKFREISEAYSVLNDPQKRDNYDKYGTADLDLDGMGFEDFMGDFGAFEDFLEEVLAFNTFEAMFEGMDKKSRKKGKARGGRAKGRATKNSKNDMFANLAKMGGMGDLGDLGGSSMEEALLEMLLQGGDVDFDDLMGGLDQEAMEKELEKMMFGSGDESSEEEDEEDLSPQEMKILEFGEKNVIRKKVGNKKKKKTELRCRFDDEKVGEDEILMHFSEKHMKEFKEWMEAPTKQETSTGPKVEEEDIQY